MMDKLRVEELKNVSNDICQDDNKHCIQMLCGCSLTTYNVIFVFIASALGTKECSNMHNLSLYKSISTLAQKGRLSKCALKGSKHALNLLRVALPHPYLAYWLFNPKNR
jgi:hypothetical protein